MLFNRVVFAVVVLMIASPLVAQEPKKIEASSEQEKVIPTFLGEKTEKGGSGDPAKLIEAAVEKLGGMKAFKEIEDLTYKYKHNNYQKSGNLHSREIASGYYHLRDGRNEVVDGDLRDYFTTIPHGALMKSVARRVADGRVLSVVKAWLNAPVIEQSPQGKLRTTAAKDSHRGTPQGGVISPLLANIYLHAFDKMFQQSGISGTLVRYCDDFVILLRNGNSLEGFGGDIRLFPKSPSFYVAISFEIQPDLTPAARY